MEREQIINGALVLALLGATRLAKRDQPSWLHPGLLWPLFWAIYGLVSFIVMAPYPVAAAAFAWVALSSVVVLAGGSAATTLARRLQMSSDGQNVGAGREPAKALNAQIISVLILACFAVGAASIVILWRSTSAGATSEANFETFLEVARETTIQRYTLGESGPDISRYLIIGFYTGCMLGGVFLLHGRGFYHYALCLLPVADSFIYSSIMTTRASFVFGLLFFMSGIAAELVRQGVVIRRLLTVRRALLAVSGVLLLMIWFAVSRYYRGGITTTDALFDMDTLAGQFQEETFTMLGTLPVFSVFVERGLEGDAEFGERTLFGVLRWFGVGSREQGLYREFVTFDDKTSSNVFSIYRGLIEDFGWMGSLIFLGITGFVSGWAYERVARGSTWWMAMLCAGYVTIGWSPVVSPWIYTTLVASVAMFQISLIICCRGTVALTRLQHMNAPVRHERPTAYTTL